MPATTKPGVQKPHCSASFSTKAACSGLIFSGVPSPSTVVISWPSASAASIRQEFTGSPSRSTVHAPQAPRSQTCLAPVRSRWLRSASSSVTRGSTVTCLDRAVHLQAEGDGVGSEDRGGLALGADAHHRGGGGAHAGRLQEAAAREAGDRALVAGA